MKRRINRVCALFLALALLAISCLVYGEAEDSIAEDKTLAPYFFVEGRDPAIDLFRLKETRVVTQTYAKHSILIIAVCFTVIMLTLLLKKLTRPRTQ